MTGDSIWRPPGSAIISTSGCPVVPNTVLNKLDSASKLTPTLASVMTMLSPAPTHFPVPVVQNNLLIPLYNSALATELIEDLDPCRHC